MSFLVGMAEVDKLRQSGATQEEVEAFVSMGKDEDGEATCVECD